MCGNNMRITEAEVRKVYEADVASGTEPTGIPALFIQEKGVLASVGTPKAEQSCHGTTGLATIETGGPLFPVDELEIVFAA